MFDIMKLFTRKDEVNNNGINVIYENKAVKSRILYWVNSRFVNSSFEDVLLEVGFKLGDKIYIYENLGNLFEFYYSVNKDEIVYDNVIKFVFNKNEFIVSDKDVGKYYLFSCKNGKDITLIQYERKISEDISCFSYYGDNYFMFTNNNGDYRFKLEMHVYHNYKLENINLLEDYLTSLNFPIVIEDVYKKIKEILSLDENSFSMFNLVVTKFNDLVTEDIVDLILLYNGELYEFIRTRDGRRIRFDIDGNWRYDRLENDKVLSIKYSDEEPKYRYSFRDKSKEQDEYFIGKDFIELKDCALNEVKDVKKLVKAMIFRKNG